MHTNRFVAILLALALLATLPLTTAAAVRRGRPSPAAANGPTCSLPASNAEGLEILSTYYPGYWWDPWYWDSWGPSWNVGVTFGWPYFSYGAYYAPYPYA